MSLRVLIIRVTFILVLLELLIPPWQFAPDNNLPNNFSTAYRFLLTPPVGNNAEIESTLLTLQIIITLALGIMIALSVSPRPIPQISSKKENHHGGRKIRRRSRSRGENLR